LRELAGNRDIEDNLERLDRLTQEEARMASAELLKMTHSVDGKVMGVRGDVRDKVQDVDDRVQDISIRVQDVHDNELVKDALELAGWDTAARVAYDDLDGGLL
jgi:hypothetical protein